MPSAPPTMQQRRAFVPGLRRIPAVSDENVVPYDYGATFEIAGIPGVFLAIPIVALITVAYKHFLDHQGSKTLFEGLVHQEGPPPEEEAV